MKLLLSLPFFLLFTACFWSDNQIIEDDYYGSRHRPVYMSYEKLRASVQFEAPKPIEKQGKISIYQNYLFVNEPNKGVHVFDNSNPAAPVAKGFLSVPGNVDIAISQGILYLDSYIDLIAVELHADGTCTEHKRLKNYFPYNAYQAVPESLNIYFYSIDESKGVVVGYESK